MNKPFNPAFDMPTTKLQALAVLGAWSDPTVMTFTAERAKAIVDLLSAATSPVPAINICEKLGLDKNTVIKMEKLFNYGQCRFDYDVWSGEYRFMAIREDGRPDATGKYMRRPQPPESV